MNSFSYLFTSFCHKLHLFLIVRHYLLFFPNIVFMIALPILRSIPAREVGMPVLLAISRFTLSIPKRRLHEKETPGIFMSDSTSSISSTYPSFTYYSYNVRFDLQRTMHFLLFLI